jgi:hypothetical protein
MKNFIFFRVVLVFVLFSCTKEKAVTDLTVININPSKVEKGFDIANDVEYDFDILALETNDDCLIAEAYKIAHQNGVLYVFDKQGKSVLEFDSTGKHIKKLYKVGQGPDEYVSLDAFTVNGKDIWLADNLATLLLCYDENLKLKERISIRDIVLPNDIVFIDNKLYLATNWWGSEEKNWAFGSFDVQTKKANCLLEVPQTNEETAIFTKKSQIAKNGNSCLFIQSFCDTIFEMADNKLYPAYQLEFSERYEDLQRPIEKIMDPANANIIKGIEEIKQTKNSIFLAFLDNKKYLSAIYNKNQKTCIVYQSLINSSLADLPMWQYDVFFDENEIITSYNPGYLLDYFTEERLSKISIEHYRNKIKKMLSVIDEFSNPVVFVYKIKTDSKL